MSSLETTYLLDDPSPEIVKARCNDPAVKEFMRLDSMLCKPVYMISGLKVAKDFKLEGEKSLSRGIAADVGAEVQPEVSVGGGVGVQRKDRVADEFESVGDIVFAYQLIKIKPKGWSKEKVFDVSEFKNRQAFLSDEEKAKEEVDGEVDGFTKEDLEDLKKAQVVGVEGANVAWGG